MTPAMLKVITLYRPLLETLNEIDCGIPEGHAYMVYNQLLNLDQFQSMLNGLKNQNVISVKGHYITKGNDFAKYFETLASIYKKLDLMKK